MLSTSWRPPFESLLAAAFVSLLVADVLYLKIRSSGPYEPGHCPELFWAVGLVLLGLAALRSGGASSAARMEIQPCRVLLFWLGPLSPAVHLSFLLVWVALHPPLPVYVLFCGAVLALYLAIRISAISYVNQALRQEGERQVRRLEQARISEDLHDNLNQSVTSLSAMVRAYRSARRAGNAEGAGEILDRLEETAREAGYRVSRPIGELRAGCGSALNFRTLLHQLSSDIECAFGARVHEDLRAPLDELCPEELAATYRIVSEALWNAARHAGAGNIQIESRRVGSVLLVKVRDDGRGFTVEDPAAGIGLSLMRARAEETGAKLDVISKSGAGTTVQLSFEGR